MRAEDCFLFLATRQNHTASEREGLEALARRHALNWERILLTAEKNGVAPLMYHNIISQPALAARVPERLLNRCRQYTLRTSLIKQQRARQLVQALKFLRERNIRAIVLKGASLDLLVYEQPWYTTYDDTDLVLSPRREELTDRQVKEISHFFYKKQVEYDFFDHHDVTMNGMLPVDFETIWKTACPVSFDGEEVFVLAPEDQLISICINSCRKRFFKLKSLLDIYETVKKDPAFDWDEFARRCRKYECGPIVYTALYVAKKTMGLQIPANVYGSLGVSAVRKAVIQLNVGFLLTFWSLAFQSARARVFNRPIDPRLILPYAAYDTDQIMHKAHEIQAANQDLTEKK